jgi:hypothetical protein
LIGGLADGDPGPVVERLVGQAFTTVTADGVENRWDASATGISGGVLLVGGTIPNMTGVRTATTSVIFLPTENPGTPMRYDALLPTPRAAHTATLIGDDLLLCGGIDNTGAPVASCEVIGTNPIVWKRTLPTGTARTGHVAVALETGPVLIAGGVDASGAPVASIEIYTP